MNMLYDEESVSKGVAGRQPAEFQLFMVGRGVGINKLLE